MSENFRVDTGCLEATRLSRVAGGSADAAERLAVFRHASTCAACGDALLALSLADNPGTADEEALVTSVLASPCAPVPLPVPALPRTSMRSRPRWRFRAAIAGAAAAACAALVGLVVVSRDRAPDPTLLALAASNRAVEGRLSLDLPHAPFRPNRGFDGSLEAVEQTLARFLSEKQRDPARARPLAALYLARNHPGDLNRADLELLAAPPGAERDSDRAVVLLAQGRAQEALRAAQSALEARPDYAPARFNLALALEAVGRRVEAARALRDYLAGADVAGPEAPWVTEARERLARLESAEEP